MGVGATLGVEPSSSVQPPGSPCARSRTGLPLHSTTARWETPRRFQRRIWASKRGGSFTGGWRFFVWRPTNGASIEYALVEVHMSAVYRRRHGGAADRR